MTAIQLAANALGWALVCVGVALILYYLFWSDGQ